MSKDYTHICLGPFTYGTGVCPHGWNTKHLLTSEDADHTNHLTNCGLLPSQRIVKRDERDTSDEIKVE